MSEILAVIREWAEDSIEAISMEDSGYANGYRKAAKDVLAILDQDTT